MKKLLIIFSIIISSLAYALPGSGEEEFVYNQNLVDDAQKYLAQEKKRNENLQQKIANEKDKTKKSEYIKEQYILENKINTVSNNIVLYKALNKEFSENSVAERKKTIVKEGADLESNLLDFIGEVTGKIALAFEPQSQKFEPISAEDELKRSGLPDPDKVTQKDKDNLADLQDVSFLESKFVFNKKDKALKRLMELNKIATDMLVLMKIRTRQLTGSYEYDQQFDDLINQLKKQALIALEPDEKVLSAQNAALQAFAKKIRADESAFGRIPTEQQELDALITEIDILDREYRKIFSAIEKLHKMLGLKLDLPEFFLWNFRPAIFERRRRLGASKIS